MVIGLKHGAITAQDKAAKEHTHQVVRDFNGRFKARNQSLVCKELLDCDISTAAGFEEAKQKGLLTSLCPKFVTRPQRHPEPRPPAEIPSPPTTPKNHRYKG